jgi:hypothetical protein
MNTGFLEHDSGVAQISKSAVSPTSQSARLSEIRTLLELLDGLRVGNPRYSRFGNLRYGVEEFWGADTLMSRGYCPAAASPPGSHIE